MNFQQRLLSLGLLAALTYTSAWGQSAQQQRFLNGIHLLDNFIDRFNHAVLPTVHVLVKGGADDDAYADTQDSIQKIADGLGREKALLSLFAREAIENTERRQLQTFVNQITDTLNPVLLDFYDTNWYAEVIAKVNHRGKLHRITLTLANKSIQQGVSYWHLVGCYASFFEISATAGHRLGLNAGSHEIDFINLKNAFDSKNEFASMMPTNYEKDHLSMLLYAVENGDLEFLGVEKVRYHFLQVPGWAFSVEHFPSNPEVTGWLISDVVALSEEAKSDYKTQILHVRK